MLAGAVACVLAIACVNLSNLLLARINVRRQEFAVRVALGARRRHLIEQALAESLLLAAAGAAIGIPLAIWATRALAGLETFGVPLLQNATVDPVALGVTIGLTVLAGVACGVLPAWHLSRGDHAQQNATHQRTAGRSSTSARSALVVVEVALACCTARGRRPAVPQLPRAAQVHLGFQPQQAMAWRVDAPRSFNSLAEANQYLDGVVRTVAALPGVEAVGLSDVLPLGRNRTWGIRAKGVEYPPGRAHRLPAHGRSALSAGDADPRGPGRPVLRRSRHRDEREDGHHQRAPRARALADRDAIGQQITQNGGTTVIGIVADVRHGTLEKAGGNEMYLHYRQSGDW